MRQQAIRWAFRTAVEIEIEIDRRDAVGQARRLNALTIAWNAVEGALLIGVSAAWMAVRTWRSDGLTDGACSSAGRTESTAPPETDRITVQLASVRIGKQALAMTDVIDIDAATDEMHGMVLSLLPPDLLDLSDIDVARARVAGLLEAMDRPPMPEDVTVSEAMVPGFDGGPDVRVKFYRPDAMAEASPAMVWIHGGGMVLMDADGDDLACAFRAAQHGCLVASVDYRLAPETPAPGAIHDCYAAFRHVVDSADELSIDPGRVMIAGASAGGGLAAGTSIFARDQDGPMPSAQLLVFPMLDHRNTTPSSHAIVDHRVWNRSANLAAWEAYLGGSEASAYSSPSICDDLSGLPPAHINVGSLDMFMDEDVEYATRLNRAGVACELRVYPGAFHGSQGFVPDHPLSQRWVADEAAFVERALAGQP